MAHASGIMSGGLEQSAELYMRQYLKAPGLVLMEYRSTKEDLFTSLHSQTYLKFLHETDEAKADKLNKEMAGYIELKGINSSNLAGIKLLEGLAEHHLRPLWKTSDMTDELKAGLMIKSCAINASFIDRAKGSKDTAGQMLEGFREDLKKYYGMECFNIDHFLTDDALKRDQSNVAKLARENIKKIGADRIIAALPYDIIPKEQAQQEENARVEYKNARGFKENGEAYIPKKPRIITDEKILKRMDSVQFDNGETKGEPVKPEVAFYGLLVAKGFVTIDQLASEGPIAMHNMRNALANEVEIMKKNGVEPITTPAADITEGKYKPTNIILNK